MSLLQTGPVLHVRVVAFLRAAGFGFARHGPLARSWLHKAASFTSGVLCGVPIMLGAIKLTGFAAISHAHQRLAIEARFLAVPQEVRYLARGEWLDEQLIQILKDGSQDADAFLEHRFVLIDGLSQPLICAPDGALPATGFLVVSFNGLRTVMPRSGALIYEVHTLCSIRM